VYTVVFALAVIFLLGLIVDGGMALNAKERAADIAGQAARAAADDINVGALRGGAVQINALTACRPTASSLVSSYVAGIKGGVDHVLSATMNACTLSGGGQTATVTVQITTTPLLPGVLGSFTETAQASATVECGITQGVKCP
jgi:Flp pilus assembly protein TadG